jgi:hypothetical protein
MKKEIESIKNPTLTEMVSLFFKGQEVNNHFVIRYQGKKYEVVWQPYDEGSPAYIALDEPTEWKNIIQEDRWTIPTSEQINFAKELLSNGVVSSLLQYGYGSQPNYSQDLLDQKHA